MSGRSERGPLSQEQLVDERLQDLALSGGPVLLVKANDQQSFCTQVSENVYLLGAQLLHETDSGMLYCSARFCVERERSR